MSIELEDLWFNVVYCFEEGMFIYWIMGKVNWLELEGYNEFLVFWCDIGKVFDLYNVELVDEVIWVCYEVYFLYEIVILVESKGSSWNVVEYVLFL